jgi:hypothetical protein
MALYILSAVTGLILCCAGGMWLFGLLQSFPRAISDLREVSQKYSLAGRIVLGALGILSFGVSICFGLLFFGAPIVLGVLLILEPSLLTESPILSNPAVPLAGVFIGLDQLLSSKKKRVPKHWLRWTSILASLFLGLAVIHYGRVEELESGPALWFVGIFAGIAYFVSSEREIARKSVDK